MYGIGNPSPSFGHAHKCRGNITDIYLILVSKEGGVRVMVFNTTFNNISVISWRSVLLMEETGVP
jgi:hypothetical protein